MEFEIDLKPVPDDNRLETAWSLLAELVIDDLPEIRRYKEQPWI